MPNRLTWLLMVGPITLVALSCGDSSATSSPKGSPNASLTLDGVSLTTSSLPTCAIHNRYQLLIQGTTPAGHVYTITSSLPSVPKTSLIDLDGKKPALFVVTDGADASIQWNTGPGAAGSVTINTDGVDGSVEAFLVKASTAPANISTPLHVSGSWFCRAIG